MEAITEDKDGGKNYSTVAPVGAMGRRPPPTYLSRCKLRVHYGLKSAVSGRVALAFAPFKKRCHSP